MAHRVPPLTDLNWAALFGSASQEADSANDMLATAQTVNTMVDPLSLAQVALCEDEDPDSGRNTPDCSAGIGDLLERFNQFVLDSNIETASPSTFIQQQAYQQGPILPLSTLIQQSASSASAASSAASFGPAVKKQDSFFARLSDSEEQITAAFQLDEYPVNKGSPIVEYIITLNNLSLEIEKELNGWLAAEIKKTADLESVSKTLIDRKNEIRKRVLRVYRELQQRIEPSSVKAKPKKSTKKKEAEQIPIAYSAPQTLPVKELGISLQSGDPKATVYQMIDQRNLRKFYLGNNSNLGLITPQKLVRDLGQQILRYARWYKDAAQSSGISQLQLIEKIQKVSTWISSEKASLKDESTLLCEASDLAEDPLPDPKDPSVLPTPNEEPLDTGLFIPSNIKEILAAVENSIKIHQMADDTKTD